MGRVSSERTNISPHEGNLTFLSRENSKTISVIALLMLLEVLDALNGHWSREVKIWRYCRLRP